MNEIPHDQRVRMQQLEELKQRKEREEKPSDQTKEEK